MQFRVTGLPHAPPLNATLLYFVATYRETPALVGLAARLAFAAFPLLRR